MYIINGRPLFVSNNQTCHTPRSSGSLWHVSRTKLYKYSGMSYTCLSALSHSECLQLSASHTIPVNVRLCRPLMSWNFIFVYDVTLCFFKVICVLMLWQCCAYDLIRLRHKKHYSIKVGEKIQIKIPFSVAKKHNWRSLVVGIKTSRGFTVRNVQM